MVKTIDYKKRLAEIALIKLEELSDEAVLHLLAERKQLQELQEEYDKLKEEQAAVAQKEAEKTAIVAELERLNKLITPDKPDDELIHLIEERKVWEAKMDALGGGGNATAVVSPEETVPHEHPAPVPVAEVSEPVSAPESTGEQIEPLVEESPETRGQGAITGVVIDQDFGREKVTAVEFDENNEFYPFLEQIKGSGGAMGKILEGLPVRAKRDKLFMLEVAKVDPSYAMHYADQVLKKDHDFNVKVASTKNNRGSGSALAEMLPEARTPEVVMAGIKADYRNVRFLLPQMDGYDDMLNRAKSGALQRIKELKDSADVSLLVPKILKKDKEFMKRVEEIVPGSEASV
ncbi:MAG: hypothetical protein KBD27_00470 [Candidatus Moranbacteria bacterium]|nr:hypothetical protein [Candidatus Moranbacteria bacterium]